MNRTKEARGEAFKGKRSRRKKPEEVARGRLEWQSKTEGELKKLRPRYLH